MKEDISTPELVAHIERIIGRTLPTDYRNWLLNPAAIPHTPLSVTIPDDSPWTDTIETFYRAEKVFEEVQREAEFNASGVRDFPVDTLPIGDNDNGDHFLLSLRESDFGSIYYFFHETADPMEDDWGGVYVLASNLPQWLETLEAVERDESSQDWETSRRLELETFLNTPPKPWWKFW